MSDQRGHPSGWWFSPAWWWLLDRVTREGRRQRAYRHQHKPVMDGQTYRAMGHEGGK